MVDNSEVIHVEGLGHTVSSHTDVTVYTIGLSTLWVIWAWSDHRMVVVTRCVAPEWLVRSPLSSLRVTGPSRRMPALSSVFSVSRYTEPAVVAPLPTSGPGPGSHTTQDPALGSGILSGRGEIVGTHTIMTFWLNPFLSKTTGLIPHFKFLIVAFHQ